MADRTFTIDIVTPERILVHDEATSLVAPGTEGSFGILPNHAPLLAELGIGELRYRRGSAEEIRLAISGGFLQVFENEVSVLADSAERAEEINLEQVRRARDEARALLSGSGGTPPDAETRKQAETALAQAENRLRVAGD